MAKRKAVMGTADDIVLAAGRNLMHITMKEAELHIDREGFASIEGLDECDTKKLAVLGRALVAFSEEIDNKESPVLKLLVTLTMEEVINNAEEIPGGIDEDDVDEEYVANPDHIDPMFG